MLLTAMAYPPGGDAGGLDAFLAQIDDAASAGFSRVWVPQLPPGPEIASWDALTALAVAGTRTPDIELGTGVVVAYTQHPLALARQALTVSSVAPGRLILGVGVSHRFVIEDMLGYSYAAPAAFLREYLEVLSLALAGQPVDHHGERITAVGQVDLPGVPAPSLITAALGPRMLDLAGELTAGTIATWTGPKALESQIIPRITTAAAAAGRPSPQIVVGVPTVVTNDVETARQRVLATMGQSGEMPAYRSILDVEGVDSIADVCLIGDEEQVAARLRHFADIGVTEFVALPDGDDETRSRTVKFLRSLTF